MVIGAFLQVPPANLRNGRDAPLALAQFRGLSALQRQNRGASPPVEVKFAECSERHTQVVFLELEGWDAEEVYVQRMSNSLPEYIQRKVVQSVEGLENARITRLGYAVEYDFIPPLDFLRSGTCGYEEAAGYGVLASENAELGTAGKPLTILGREQAYLGVIADDLISGAPSEPYRVFGARVERRLVLSQHTAHFGLTEIVKKNMIVSRSREQQVRQSRQRIDVVTKFPGRMKWDGYRCFPVRDLLSGPGFSLRKYVGYLAREHADVARMRRLSSARLPPSAE